MGEFEGPKLPQSALAIRSAESMSLDQK